jgi:prepilin-type processing-associated H-X9-DG protein
VQPPAPNTTGQAGDYFGPNSFLSSLYGVQALSGDNTVTAMKDEANRKLVEITDGTSTTLLVTEMAGRPDLYVLGRKQASNAAMSNPTKWGAWASYQVVQFGQWGADGITRDGAGGPCTINCNNSQGVYAFHPGGANAVFCDGSVRFLRQGLHPNTLFGMITVSGGEILAEDF